MAQARSDGATRMWCKYFLGSALAMLIAFSSAAPAADEKDVVDTTISLKDLTVLAVAIREADLVETLRGKGPLTLFAPTDEAFKRLGDDRIKAIVKDKELLKKILLAHVVPTKALTAKDLAALNGQDLNGFRVDAGGGLKIGPAKVTRPDIQCSNGIIHVIDTVLIKD